MANELVKRMVKKDGSQRISFYRGMKIDWDFVGGFLCCCLMLIMIWAFLWVWYA